MHSCDGLVKALSIDEDNKFVPGTGIKVADDKKNSSWIFRKHVA
jgi:hypothetical protein